MPLSNKEIIATVKRHKHSIDIKTIGISNENTLLDTRIYKAELTGVAVEELSANTIE